MRVVAPAYNPAGRVAFSYLPDGTPIGPVQRDPASGQEHRRLRRPGPLQRAGIPRPQAHRDIDPGFDLRRGRLVRVRLGRRGAAAVLGRPGERSRAGCLQHRRRFGGPRWLRPPAALRRSARRTHRDGDRRRLHGERSARVRAGRAGAPRAWAAAGRQELPDRTFRAVRDRRDGDSPVAEPRTGGGPNRVAGPEPRRHRGVRCVGGRGEVVSGSGCESLWRAGAPSCSSCRHGRCGRAPTRTAARWHARTTRSSGCCARPGCRLWMCAESSNSGEVRSACTSPAMDIGLRRATGLRPNSWLSRSKVVQAFRPANPRQA